MHVSCEVFHKLCGRRARLCVPIMSLSWLCPPLDTLAGQLCKFVDASRVGRQAGGAGSPDEGC